MSCDEREPSHSIDRPLLPAFQGRPGVIRSHLQLHSGGSGEKWIALELEAEAENAATSISVTTGMRKAFGGSGWGMSAAVRNNVTAALGNEDTRGFGFIFGLHHGPVQVVSIAPPPVIPVPVPVPIPAPVRVEPPKEPVVRPAEPRGLLQRKIDFDAGSARTTNIAKAILDYVALRMRQEPTSTLIVTGYATAAELRSQSRLDLRRAEAVRDFLTSRHNVAASRISVQAGGEGNMASDLKLVVP